MEASTSAVNQDLVKAMTSREQQLQNDEIIKLLLLFLLFVVGVTSNHTLNRLHAKNPNIRLNLYSLLNDPYNLFFVLPLPN